MIYEHESTLKTLPCESYTQMADIVSQQSKKEKLLEKLKTEKFASMKGSSKIIEKIKKQREAFESKIEDQKDRIIFKQQKLVRQLNQENQLLEEESCELKAKLTNLKNERNRLADKANEFMEQGESLRDQLKVSQTYSVNLLNELKNSKYSYSKISI